MSDLERPTDEHELTRRGFLGTTIAASVVPAGLARGDDESGDPARWRRTADAQGDLEDWTATDPATATTLPRVSLPYGVTDADYAVRVQSDGAAEPSVHSPSAFSDGRIDRAPYLAVDVTPRNKAVEEDLAVDVAAITGDGTVVERRESVPIDWQRSRSVTLDLSTLSRDRRRSVHGLDIEWRPVAARDAYRGDLYVSDVRVTDRPEAYGELELAEQISAYEYEHGPAESPHVHDIDENRETGSLRFSDGTTVQYESERVGEDRYRYTIDGRSYPIGGGWS